MTNYPTNWGEVYYLIRKEVRERPDLPALSLDDIHKLSNIFWRLIKESLREDYAPIKLFGFINFKPRAKQIKRAERTKQYLREKYEKQKQKEESIQSA